MGYKIQEKNGKPKIVATTPRDYFIPYETIEAARAGLKTWGKQLPSTPQPPESPELTHAMLIHGVPSNPTRAIARQAEYARNNAADNDDEETRS